MTDDEIEIKNLERKLIVAYHLLDRSLPYIQQHFEKSIFGDGARKLIKAILEFKESLVLK